MLTLPLRTTGHVVHFANGRINTMKPNLVVSMLLYFAIFHDASSEQTNVDDEKGTADILARLSHNSLERFWTVVDEVNISVSDFLVVVFFVYVYVCLSINVRPYTFSNMRLTEHDVSALLLSSLQLFFFVQVTFLLTFE